MSTIRTITVEQLAEALESNAVAELWNVLTDDYFTGEMIPGSRRLPLDRIVYGVRALRVAADAPIVVYCSGPACPQSGAAAAKLATLGYTNVQALEGGLQAWTEAGHAVEPVAVAAAAAAAA